MADYTWRPKGLRIRESAIIIEPLLAYKKFVVPGLGDPNWIEDGTRITDTDMMMREWAGLVLHAFSLMKLTGQDIKVGKDTVGGDGVLLRKSLSERGGYEGVYVEQTLATYKAHSDVNVGIKHELAKKSGKGDGYAENRHLIIWCNMNGEFNPKELAKAVSEGAFNIVNIIGFDGATREYRSLVFDKDVIDRPINSVRIDEKMLVESAREVEDPKPQGSK